MKLYLYRPSSKVNATAEYDAETKTFIVLKGSTVSGEIAYSKTFRGAKSIEKARQGVVVGNIVTEDVYFKSASTAANFVTGASTNGLIAWKDCKGKSLKRLLEEMESKNE